MRIGPDFGFYARRLVAESNPAVWESDFYSLAEINWRGVSFGYKVTDSGMLLCGMTLRSRRTLTFHLNQIDLMAACQSHA